MDIHNATDGTSEVLAYLEIDSPDFQQAYSRLLTASRPVMVREWKESP